MPKKKVEYTLVGNDSGDEYVIPLDKLEHWYDEWMHSEDYELGNTPNYAVYVGGRLTFEKWSVK